MPETIFFNVWRTDSRDKQEELLATMRAEAGALAARQGFRSLAAWRSEDGGRVIVEGRWASRADFDAAVKDNPAAQAGRLRLESLAQAEPGLFEEGFRIEGTPVPTPETGAVAFVQVWEVGAPDQQEAWLQTMRERVGALTGRAGLAYIATHASMDGKRTAVYAQWRDQPSLEAAVNSPEARAGHHTLREHGTPDGAVYRVTEVFAADRTAALRSEAGDRWKQLGFETSMVPLSDVGIHVATAGAGRPLVLLHGYPQSGEIWRHVAPQLAENRRVIIPDLRGMGLSDIPRDGYDLPSVAKDIHELLKALNVEETDIAGHDWGGAVATVFALQYRSSVGRLAFIESAVGGAGFEDLWSFSQPNPALTFIPLLLAEGLAETLIAGREEAFLHHLWDTFTHEKERVPFADWERYVDAMKRPGLIRSGAGYYRSVYGAADAIRESIRLGGKLSIPVLSVAGAASLGSLQESLVQNFASNIAAHRVIADAAHFIAEEQPEALLSEFRWFLGLAEER